MGDLYLGTVYSTSSGGVRVTLDGSEEPMSKEYKRLNSVSLSVGDRVLLVKISGTYIILGKIT